MDTGFSGLVAGIFYGLLAAGVAVLLVAGGFVLSFSEGSAPLAFLPSPTILSATLTTIEPARQLTEGPTAIASAADTLPVSPSPTNKPSPSVTATPTPTQTVCVPPKGWQAIDISRGDTLNKLAQEYGTSPEDLIEANCLVKSQLEIGTTLYVPGEIHPTQSPCGPPPGWIYAYIVQPGDTLFSISHRAGVSVGQIKRANCLSSDSIRVSKKLYLPVTIQPPGPPAPTATRTKPTYLPPTNTPEVIEWTPSPPDPPGTR